MSRLSPARIAILESAITALEEPPHEVNVRRVAQIAKRSRQAAYLHFANRADLLIALARYTDERLDLEKHLAPVRQARDAADLLRRYARFLAVYNPLLYTVVRAADAMRHRDAAVAEAWNDRLRNRRQGGREVTARLAHWGALAPGWTIRTAGDWLTAQGSVKVWEELVLDLGYSARRFERMMARVFVGALLHRTTPPGTGPEPRTITKL
jgi:AcrR family transcriptional regulator